MKSFATVALAVFSVYAHPSPVKRASAIDDTTVLNFALTLEHLENAFYKGALEKFDDKAFIHAGLPSWARGRFAQVAAHEKTHVEFLSSALGNKATKPCTYNFPYTDPRSFAALSQVLEGVGVSAYTGAARLISNKDYLTAAASILSTEARHASWVAAAVNKVAGWSGSFDVPLSLNEVYTLAAPFIVSCPSTNPALPVKPFPTLTFSAKSVPGSASTVTFETSTASSTELFAVFFTGLPQEAVPLVDGTVVIPKDVRGLVYAVVSTNDIMASDGNIVAGPAILEFDFRSNRLLQ